MTQSYVPLQAAPRTAPPEVTEGEQETGSSRRARDRAQHQASASPEQEASQASPSPKAIQRVTMQICQALANAHALGVLPQIAQGMLEHLDDHVLTAFFSELGVEEELEQGGEPPSEPIDPWSFSTKDLSE